MEDLFKSSYCNLQTTLLEYRGELSWSRSWKHFLVIFISLSLMWKDKAGCICFRFLIGKFISYFSDGGRCNTPSEGALGLKDILLNLASVNNWRYHTCRFLAKYSSFRKSYSLSEIQCQFRLRKTSQKKYNEDLERFIKHIYFMLLEYFLPCLVQFVVPPWNDGANVRNIGWDVWGTLAVRINEEQ